MLGQKVGTITVPASTSAASVSPAFNTNPSGFDLAPRSIALSHSSTAGFTAATFAVQVSVNGTTVVGSFKPLVYPDTTTAVTLAPNTVRVVSVMPFSKVRIASTAAEAAARTINVWLQ